MHSAKRVASNGFIIAFFLQSAFCSVELRENAESGNNSLWVHQYDQYLHLHYAAHTQLLNIGEFSPDSKTCTVIVLFGFPVPLKRWDNKCIHEFQGLLSEPVNLMNNPGGSSPLWPHKEPAGLAARGHWGVTKRIRTLSLYLSRRQRSGFHTEVTVAWRRKQDPAR